MERGDFCLLGVWARSGGEVLEKDLGFHSAPDQKEVLGRSQKFLLPSELLQAQAHLWVNETVDGDKSESWRETRIQTRILPGRKAGVRRTGQGRPVQLRHGLGRKQEGQNTLRERRD